MGILLSESVVIPFVWWGDTLSHVSLSSTSRLYLISWLTVLCERFEPRSHFISRLSVIVRVNVVLNRTVFDSDPRFDNLCGSHLQGQSELYHVS